MRFSPTAINTFFQCPRKWYYQSVQAPENIVDDRRALLGSAIHSMIQLYFTRQVERPTESDIDRLAWEIFTTTYDPIIKEFEKTAKRIWTNFIKFEKKRLREWRRYKPVFVEEMLEISNTIRGIVDFYGDERIIDWKTGSFYFLNKDFVRQGNFYRFMLERSGYTVKEILFVFLKDDKVVKIPKKSDGWVQEEISRVKRMIQQGYFPKKESQLCRFCEYRLVCEFSDTDWYSLRW